MKILVLVAALGSIAVANATPRLKQIKPIPDKFFEAPAYSDSMEREIWYVQGLQDSDGLSPVPVCRATVTYWYGSLRLTLDLSTQEISLQAQQHTWSLPMDRPFMVDLLAYDYASKASSTLSLQAVATEDDTLVVHGLKTDYLWTIESAFGLSLAKQGGVPLNVSLPQGLKSPLGKLASCVNAYKKFFSSKP